MDDRNHGLTPPPRHEVLGVPVHMVTMDSALAEVRRLLLTPGADMIVAANPEKVVAARRNPDLLSAIRDAALVIPDGIGVVIAARLAGQQAVARVPGSELMPALCALAAEEAVPVFLYGAQPAVIETTMSLLQESYPGLKIVGHQHGFLPESGMEGLLDAINRSGAQILFVGLGSPRQELWMSRNRHRLSGVRVCQGVGGTFDAICGHPRRAPDLMRRLNLEWLYRLVSQPARIHRQRALPLFATQVIRETLVRRRRARSQG
ncbi:N-acetylglucosaminyldiphosphoundecaprenol N-acetyl-beta-D-mannosaminyltransferase [Natronocella acetinitrilica]|uniref:N-acetylglucosaminyldiphosphoundecaprenol N-acetyl-beta-D-mannosaminyltransferase n=1 Tax=Natronocella acetinitrilica TaxID=414046 RepID=A0AAE3KBN4_9GAMM|nr:WecB/TagA/CpsF family glycosyltransferase [Natronocella acetinitrilica]MCP1675815.1 N-acetylglucosaminyldiphosphoundecaprenol N-acetyl-beta-D-mannosaminyltransferase [Natronocella acetinitrilica]